MSLEKTLESIEERYYGDLEEDRNAVLPEFEALHNAALSKGIEEFRAFSDLAKLTCGGLYLPYIMWVELGEYVDHHNNRERIFDLISTFVNSAFEEEERIKMKSLLITYFAMEREFEVNKLITLVVEKAHPSVIEYFRKVQNFVLKNKTSVDMYIEKFQMLKDYAPNFEMLRMPVSKLKEVIG